MLGDGVYCSMQSLFAIVGNGTGNAGWIRLFLFFFSDFEFPKKNERKRAGMGMHGTELAPIQKMGSNFYHECTAKSRKMMERIEALSKKVR